MKEDLIKLASLIIEIQEMIRTHDPLAECPFCMNELFEKEELELARRVIDEHG